MQEYYVYTAKDNTSLWGMNPRAHFIQLAMESLSSTTKVPLAFVQSMEKISSPSFCILFARVGEGREAQSVSVGIALCPQRTLADNGNNALLMWAQSRPVDEITFMPRIRLKKEKIVRD